MTKPEAIWSHIGSGIEMARVSGLNLYVAGCRGNWQPMIQDREHYAAGDAKYLDHYPTKNAAKVAAEAYALAEITRAS